MMDNQDDGVPNRSDSVQLSRRAKDKLNGTRARNQGARKSEITRARILDAAAEVFMEKGYALARIGDIAKKAGTQPSSIYYYFDSREAVVEEVLSIANNRTDRSVRRAIEALHKTADLRARITAAIHGQVDSVLSGDPSTAAHMRIFDQIPPKMREHFLRILDENAELWRALLFEAQQNGLLRPEIDISVARLLLFGMMNWSIEWYKPGRMTPDDVAEQVALLFLDGTFVRDR